MDLLSLTSKDFSDARENRKELRTASALTNGDLWLFVEPGTQEEKLSLLPIGWRIATRTELEMVYKVKEIESKKYKINGKTITFKQWIIGLMQSGYDTLNKYKKGCVINYDIINSVSREHITLTKDQAEYLNKYHFNSQFSI